MAEEAGGGGVNQPIPFSRPDIRKQELDAVQRVFRSGWLTVGREVQAFESQLAHQLGARHVIAVDSCTSALTLTLRTFDPEPDERAVVPALTFVATANAAYHAGFEIDFCDVGPDGCIEADQASRSARVVVPVHFAGQACDLKVLWALGLPVVEDAAQALGARFNNRLIGSDSRSVATCFSFYPTKTITTGEGGAVTTPDPELAGRIKTLSLHGLGGAHVQRYERSSLSRPTIGEPGYKANMTDVEAAIGQVQLARLSGFLERRRDIARRYREGLADQVETLSVRNEAEHAWHLFVVLVEDRDAFVERMAAADIGVGVHYSPPLHLHPFYQERYGHAEGDFPVAERISARCVSLPLWPGMSDEQVETVIQAVRQNV